MVMLWQNINNKDKPMSHFNEHTLEMAIMELIEQQGYSGVNGQTIHKEQRTKYWQYMFKEQNN